MKREDQTVIQCKQPIKLEKPLQCLRYSLIKSSVKKKSCCHFQSSSHGWKHNENTGTAEREGLVRPRPHHFFAPPFPLFALKKKNENEKKDLKRVFFRLYSAIFSVFFFNFKRQAFCGAPVLFAVIVPWGRLAPWSNALPWPPLRFVRQRVLYFQLRQSFLSVLSD